VISAKVGIFGDGTYFIRWQKRLLKDENKLWSFLEEQLLRNNQVKLLKTHRDRSSNPRPNTLTRAASQMIALLCYYFAGLRNISETQGDRKVTQPVLKCLLMVAIQYNSTGLINNSVDSVNVFIYRDANQVLGLARGLTLYLTLICRTSHNTVKAVSLSVKDHLYRTPKLQYSNNCVIFYVIQIANQSINSGNSHLNNILEHSYWTTNQNPAGGISQWLG
jgi:hypothetical protein